MIPIVDVFVDYFLTSSIAKNKNRTMELEIRRALHSDATNIIVAHRRSIRELCSRDYSLDQIAAWSGIDFQEDRWHQTMDKDLVWVIADKENHIFGFGHLKFNNNFEAEIAGLYFVPEVTGQSFGKKIAQLIFSECRERGVRSISLLSTITAKTFYESISFEQIGPPREILIGGKSIECFKMQKNLS